MPHLLFLGLLALWAPPQGAGPVLSEFMADNQGTLEDEDGDDPDWIELFNPTGATVDLSGWYLTDDAARPTRWAFPAGTTLAPYRTLVVFASGKDRVVPGQPLHTDFKLAAAGGYLALVDPSGLPFDEFAPVYPPQYQDISYGRVFDPALSSRLAYFSPGSPDARNGLGGPLPLNPQHAPAAPNPGESVVVTIQPVPGPGTLLDKAYVQYRTNFGSRTRDRLVDDGSGADAVAGDGVYTGIVPGAGRGDMLRWRFLLDDDQGGRNVYPPYPDPNQSPQYLGTMVNDASVKSPLPVAYWFVEYPYLADQRTGTQCSLYFQGVFYDNLFVRSRGGSSAAYLKRNYKLIFNPGYRFLFDPAYPPVHEINFNSTWSDKAFIRQHLSLRTYDQAGVAASESAMIRLQQNGSFFSVAISIEQPDEDLLAREGLDPAGALYKMYNFLDYANVGVEKKTRLWEDNSDLQALVTGLQLPNGPALEAFLFDNIDVAAVINYIAATTIVHDNDHLAKNYYLYRDSDGDQEWRFLPWDKDLTWGRMYTISGGVLNDQMFANTDPYSHPLFGDRYRQKIDGGYNHLIDACHQTPRIRQLYLRRLRTLMDEWLESRSVPLAQRKIEGLLAQWQSDLLKDTELDEARWGIPSWGTLRLDFTEALDQLRNAYLVPRRPHLFQTHAGLIPKRQKAPHLGFGRIERDPVSGDQDEEYVEILNPGVESVDLSGWTLGGGISFTFPAGTVVGAGDALFASPDLPTFRNRTSSPTGGEGNLVSGPFQGHISPTEDVTLLDEGGVLVATTGAPQMTVRDLVAGQNARFTVVGLAPGEPAMFLLSLTGGGPTTTPYGPMDLTLPVYNLGAPPADATGTAEIVLTVPPGASGLPVWLQAFDVTRLGFTNSFALVIG